MKFPPVTKKIGGFVALVGGVMGATAAVVTMMTGSTGAALNYANAASLINLGWVWFFCSLLSIVASTLAITGNGKLPGVICVVAAILAMLFGGKLAVGIMLLVAIGGVLAFLSDMGTQPQRQYA